MKNIDGQLKIRKNQIANLFLHENELKDLKVKHFLKISFGDLFMKAGDIVEVEYKDGNKTGLYKLLKEESVEIKDYDNDKNLKWSHVCGNKECILLWTACEIDNPEDKVEFYSNKISRIAVRKNEEGYYCAYMSGFNQIPGNVNPIAQNKLKRGDKVVLEHYYNRSDIQVVIDSVRDSVEEGKDNYVYCGQVVDNPDWVKNYKINHFYFTEYYIHKLVVKEKQH